MSIITDAGVNRITAGLPSLTPQKRSGWDERIRSRALADEAERIQKLRDVEFLTPDGDMDSTNVLQRMGRALHSSQLSEKLRKVNPNLIFEKSIADPRKMGIYVTQTVTDLESALGVPDRLFVCGMEAEMSPEFTVPHYKSKLVPDSDNPGNMIEQQEFCGMTRGWREVLLCLMKAELVTLGQVEKEFQIAGGQSSAHWQRFTT